MNGSGESDAALVGRLIDGQQDALTELYDRHAGAVYRSALRILRDAGAAEEIVQETMLTLWDHAESFDAGIGTLTTWLATIARNRAIDRHRVIARRALTLPLSSIGAHDADATDQSDRILDAGTPIASGLDAPEPAAAAEARWTREALARAVATLPDSERQVIELAYSGDLSQSEIATRLGWPLGTVKTRTRRALASLRAVLADTFAPADEPCGPSTRVGSLGGTPAASPWPC